MKVFLRSAREAINQKDYEAALKAVETGLASDELEDPENKQHHYTLLVFKALALQNLGRSQEAVEIYEKATMLNPALPLSWQVRKTNKSLSYFFLGITWSIGVYQR